MAQPTDHSRPFVLPPNTDVVEVGNIEYIPATLNGSPVPLLYDTKASICTISIRLVRRLGLQHLLQEVNASCSMAGGQMAVSQQIMLDVMMLGAVRSTQFLVSGETDPSKLPLLGTPIINPRNS